MKFAPVALLATFALVFACEQTPVPQCPTVASVAPIASAPEDPRPMRERYPPGGSCKDLGRYVCDDDRVTALYCDEGTVREIPCRGAKGCEGRSKNPNCEDGLAKLGDPCMPLDHQSYACATDLAAAFLCEKGKYALWRHCKGPKACSVHDDKVDCDNTIGDVGDPCGQNGSFVCSVDGMMLLMCQDRALIAANGCRGPKRCRLLADNKNHCDDSAAKEGDPCDTPDEVSCSLDGKAELTCKRGVYAKKQDCKRRDGCVVRDGQLFCAF